VRGLTRKRRIRIIGGGGIIGRILRQYSLGITSMDGKRNSYGARRAPFEVVYEEFDCWPALSIGNRELRGGEWR